MPGNRRRLIVAGAVAAFSGLAGPVVAQDTGSATGKDCKAEPIIG